jgi:hypothetical protein
MQRQPLLVQYKQQASSFLSLNTYTQLVISGNDKNKQITLLSQGKLALTARYILFAYTIIGALKNLQKNCPRTNNKCHRKPNPIS